MRRVWLLVQVLGLINPLPAQAAEPQQVSLTSLDSSTITAWVFQPDGKPRGTVVALHGCGGLFATEGSRTGRISARHQAMAERLGVPRL